MTAKNRILIGIGALLLAGGGLYFWKFKSVPKVTYREMTVKKGDLSITILTTGTVQPENRLEIKPPVAGRVEQVLVKEGQKVKKGQILAWMSSTERAALLDAARAQGADELRRWEDLYRPTPLVAPINGTIILRNVESGQTFTTADPVLVMSDRLTVKAQVDETDIAQVKLKMRSEIVLDAYSGSKIPGQVDQIAFEAKTVNNVTTYLVDVLPDATPEFMRAGMTANVTFFIESKKNVLLVPNEALTIKDGSTSVLARSQAGTPVERAIQIGMSDGKQTEVIDGLMEDETIFVAKLNQRQQKSNKNASPFSPTRSRGR